MKTTDDQGELFIVVDKNDTIVGYKTRKDCHLDKRLIHRAVGVILFTSNGEILLQKRSKTKDLYPGMYAISASGHVSKGETYEETAVRELKEEMGIGTVPIQFVSKHLVETNKETEMNVLYKGVYDGDVLFFPDEVESVHYFNKEQVKNMKDTITPCSKKSLEIIGWL